jgi:hypothetical protein
MNFRDLPIRRKLALLIRMHGGADVSDNRGSIAQQDTTGNPARCYVTVLVLVIVCSMGHPAWGQVSGRFLGTVTDAGEAALPNATVTLRNADTGLVRQTRTNQPGNFEIMAVPAAEGYAITA